MDAEHLNSFVRLSIEYGTPILLAALGEIFAERSGVLNLGLEGLVAVGGAVAFVVSLTTESPWLGIAAAVLAAAALSAVHALVAVRLRGNQVVSGLALTIVGMGLASLVASKHVGLRGNPIEITVDLGPLGSVPLLGGLDRLDPIVYASMLLSVALWLALFKTKLGLKVRACGEDPAAAEALGHDVLLTRMVTTVLGGATAGIAGSYVTLVMSPGWFEGITAGRGWLAIGVVIFSSWNPLRALVLSYVFGGLMQLRFVLAPYIGAGGVLLRSLPYLMVIVLLVVLSFEPLRRRSGAPESLGRPYPP